MNNEQFERFLAGALKRRAKAPQADEAAVERVLKRLSGPLPFKHPLDRGLVGLRSFGAALERTSEKSLELFVVHINQPRRSFDLNAHANSAYRAPAMSRPPTPTCRACPPPAHCSCPRCKLS